ncbi:MAG: hypothetical protein LBP39_01675 [Rickettsiales bacterium]|jgi:predicted outer membrane repeat protein|nr:hypothetical protein [Rickettsiales bacterium]
MKINKKVNYSKITALSSCLFLGTLAIFIGLGAEVCLASVTKVSSFSNLEKAIGDNNSLILNIKANSIRLDQKLPVINRDLTIFGVTDGSTLDGNNAHRIFEFGPDLHKITINNTHFKHGRSENPYSNGGGVVNSMHNAHFQCSSNDQYVCSGNSYDNDGGAVYVEKGTTVLFNNVDFSNNTAVSRGGAVYSEGSTRYESILLFSGRTTFDGNFAERYGGAVFAKYSELTFGREKEFTNNQTKFTNNRSNGDGGAIYAWADKIKKNVAFSFDKYTIFAGNESIEGGGGAIYATLTDLVFNEGAKFASNTSKSNGGAIYSLGDVQQGNTLIFAGKTTFVGNKSTNNSGGAVYAEYSNLIFIEEATFEENESEYIGGAIVLYSLEGKDSKMVFKGTANFIDNSGKIGGGAINSWGNENSKNSLTFEKETKFTGNISDSGSGGAIYSLYSDLIFDEDAKFKNNSSSDRGGAILLSGSRRNIADAIFVKQAVFEGNSSRQGGAMYLWDNTNVRFHSGLKLIDNSTEEEKSGAIHMEGECKNCRVKVTIVQGGRGNSTIFKGNTSNHGQGRNAFYLKRHAKLNFIIGGGNVDLYDSIGGDRTEAGNVVTLDGFGGQFNLKENGSIDDVDLVNRGATINLEESRATSRPLHFINSGKVIFGISPENNRCSKIQALNITLEKDSKLEIVAAPGTYKAGNSYDIMVSEKPIGNLGNVSLKLPRGLRAKTELKDRFFRLFIEANDEDNGEN